MESLEARCNPAELVPIAESLVEPAPVDQAVFTGVTAYKFVDDPSRNSALDPRTGNLYVGTDNGVFRTGVVRHELGHALGFQHEHTRPASDAPAAAGNLDNDRFADIVTGAAANGHGSAATATHIKALSGIDLGELESIIDDLARDVASQTEFRSLGGHVKVFDGTTGAEIRSILAFPGFTGGVFVGAGDVNDDKIDEIIIGPCAQPHVKVIDGTRSEQESPVSISGPLTGNFRLTFKPE